MDGFLSVAYGVNKLRGRSGCGSSPTGRMGPGGRDFVDGPPGAFQTPGMSLTIRRIRAIVTRPDGINLVVVKVETSEPGLYGLGCATFAYRALAVKSYVEDYLDPLLRGRDPARIEELFQLMSVNAYWRNGPVGNNAISGVDMALWDIKGKVSGLPLYDLLGGRVRDSAPIYRHADSTDFGEMKEQIARFRELGVRHLRIQCGGYSTASSVKDAQVIAGAETRYDARRYRTVTRAMLERVREHVGEEVELLHDIHERIRPHEAVEFACELEPLKLFFLEDPLAPEELDWFDRLRGCCSTPIAQGELFTHPGEYLPLIADRKIDYMRMHMSMIGGLTPSRKAAVAGELHGVMTAWHGPGDLSPIGHAVNVHLDLASTNFGVQEFSPFKENAQQVFSGLPEFRDGALHLTGAPGIGVDMDEAAAEAFPGDHGVTTWTQLRREHGGPARP